MASSSTTGSVEAKIVVLGGQGVGKTSIVHRFVNNTAPSASTASTIGASFLTKRVTDIDSGTVVRLQIWDTAGQERFRSISKLYYRGANAAILCYDITNQASFAEMAHWLHELKANLAPDTILHIVGTKADLVAEDPSRRAVAFEGCVAYAAEHLYHHTGGGHSTTGGTTSYATTPLPTPLHPPTAAAAPAKRDNPLVASPRSNRSSMGFWGLELGWNLCHEVSASSGEGVEEVFRVITRRLVEQRAQRAALEARLADEFGAVGGEAGERDFYYHGGVAGAGAGGAGAGGAGEYVYGQGGAAGEGSFRLGIGDKRRSWLGIPPFPVGGAGAVDGTSADATKRKGGPCCT